MCLCVRVSAVSSLCVVCVCVCSWYCMFVLSVLCVRVLLLCVVLFVCACECYHVVICYDVTKHIHRHFSLSPILVFVHLCAGTSERNPAT